MDRATEHALFNKYLDGLRQYIKTESKGKLFGVQLHDQWETLTEAQQDNIISDAFIVSAERIAHYAHDAIHGTAKPVRVNRRRRDDRALE